MDQFGGGNWNVIPTISNPTTPSSSQDHLYLQQQQFQQQQHQQRYQISQQQQQKQQQPPPPQPSQSLASHFLLQTKWRIWQMRLRMELEISILIHSLLI